MKPKFTAIEITYLVLAIAGIVFTWYYNTLFYLNAEDTAITNFIVLTRTTFPAKSIVADISVVAVAFLVWMFYESRKLKIKYWWILIPLTFLIAIAFTFPLFLFYRERKIRKNAMLLEQG